MFRAVVHYYYRLLRRTIQGSALPVGRFATEQPTPSFIIHYSFNSPPGGYS